MPRRLSPRNHPHSKIPLQVPRVPREGLAQTWEKLHAGGWERDSSCPLPSSLALGLDGAESDPPRGRRGQRAPDPGGLPGPGLPSSADPAGWSTGGPLAPEALLVPGSPAARGLLDRHVSQRPWTPVASGSQKVSPWPQASRQPWRWPAPGDTRLQADSCEHRLPDRPSTRLATHPGAQPAPRAPASRPAPAEPGSWTTLSGRRPSSGGTSPGPGAGLPSALSGLCDLQPAHLLTRAPDVSTGDSSHKPPPLNHLPPAARHGPHGRVHPESLDQLIGEGLCLCVENILYLIKIHYIKYTYLNTEPRTNQWSLFALKVWI